MSYELNDYVVEIACRVGTKNIFHSFDVMAYSNTEAEDIAVSEFSKLNYQHDSTLSITSCLWDDHADRDIDY